MSLNTRDDQAEAKAIALQTRAYFPSADQSEASRRAWRERKQTRQRRQGHRETSPAKSQEDAFETNAFETNAFEPNAS